MSSLSVTFICMLAPYSGDDELRWHDPFCGHCVVGLSVIKCLHVHWIIPNSLIAMALPRAGSGLVRIVLEASNKKWAETEERKRDSHNETMRERERDRDGQTHWQRESEREDSERENHPQTCRHVSLQWIPKCSLNTELVRLSASWRFLRCCLCF